MGNKNRVNSRPSKARAWQTYRYARRNLAAYEREMDWKAVCARAAEAGTARPAKHPRPKIGAYMLPVPAGTAGAPTPAKKP